MFAWQAIWDRIPTRLNLFKRHVLNVQQDLRCVFGSGGLESTNHLFLNCPRVGFVWMKVYGWLGFDVVLPFELEAAYLFHKGLFHGKKGRKRGVVVWLSVLWMVWLERNAVLFSNAQVDVIRILDLIKCRSWSWLSAEKNCNISFAAWCINQVESLKYY